MGGTKLRPLQPCPFEDRTPQVGPLEGHIGELRPEPSRADQAAILWDGAPLRFTGFGDSGVTLSGSTLLR